MVYGYALDNIQDKVLYIKDVFDGFEKLSSITLEGNYISYANFIRHFLKQDNFFFDFYYGDIQVNERVKFNSMIEEIGISSCILDKFYFEKGKIFFQSVDCEVLDFVTKISYHNILFSTFYILNPKITIWSSYDGQVLVFFEKHNEYIGEDIVRFACKCGMKLL